MKKSFENLTKSCQKKPQKFNIKVSVESSAMLKPLKELTNAPGDCSSIVQNQLLIQFPSHERA